MPRPMHRRRNNCISCLIDLAILNFTMHKWCMYVTCEYLKRQLKCVFMAVLLLCNCAQNISFFLMYFMHIMSYQYRHTEHISLVHSENITYQKHFCIVTCKEVNSSGLRDALISASVSRNYTWQVADWSCGRGQARSGNARECLT